MTYPELYNKLTYETAFVVFLKKDGSIRLMMCTRNLNTVALAYGYQGYGLGGHDSRCNINNGNVAVIDLALGEARSFHIDRIVDVQFMGVVTTKEELDILAGKFMQFKEEYEQSKPMKMDMSMLD